ncbi:hypothetical protein RR42_s3216 [Cupriavidus basilensis]|uniref:Uncharacterized protein n=1 Tax=Cupriavidus basilensis TaxID=68895 RepID=A0A0C4YG30_9BURK|nr:hypothetical protein RR42_s3216 [Cupriavidus basilensis]
MRRACCKTGSWMPGREQICLPHRLRGVGPRGWSSALDLSGKSG